MNDILCEKIDIFVITYFDDILVFSQDPNAHEEHLYLVFNQLPKNHIKVKKPKCKFGVSSI